MSIVAERPVSAQVADRPQVGGRADVAVSAGLAEEIERQEREDNARGYEREPDGQAAQPWPMGSRSKAERQRAWDARRKAERAGASARRLSRSYLEPDRVDLRVREDVPLSPEHAARLARLVEMYDDRLRRKVRARLEYKRDADAEDVVQETWLSLSQLMDKIQGPDEDAYPFIVSRARYVELELVWNKRRREWAAERDTLEWMAGATAEDATACAVLELLDDGDGPGWSPCYADAVAALPERQREVLEMRCVDGMTTTAIAARLGVTKQSVQYHLRKALDALRPAVGAPAEEGLPEGWQAMVHRLPAMQQDVIRLKMQGLTDREVERRVGYSQGAGRRAYESAQRSLRQMARDRDADLPSLRSAGACARQCASGCYLRTARTGAAA